MKTSQLVWVRRQLKENGEISRNYCLQRYVSRLSAIIQILENQGWGFTTERRDGDYVYKIKYRPQE